MCVSGGGSSHSLGVTSNLVGRSISLSPRVRSTSPPLGPPFNSSLPPALPPSHSVMEEERNERKTKGLNGGKSFQGLDPKHTTQSPLGQILNQLCLQEHPPRPSRALPQLQSAPVPR